LFNVWEEDHDWFSVYCVYVELYVDELEIFSCTQSELQDDKFVVFPVSVLSVNDFKFEEAVEFKLR